MDENRRELLEVYKIHADLADRASRRHAGANRLYVSLLTRILLLLAVFLRYETGTVPLWDYTGNPATSEVRIRYKNLTKGRFPQRLSVFVFWIPWEGMFPSNGKEGQGNLRPDLVPTGS